MQHERPDHESEHQLVGSLPSDDDNDNQNDDQSSQYHQPDASERQHHERRHHHDARTGYRSSPDANTTIIGKIPGNTRINITQVNGNWGRVTYDGNTGWVSLDWCVKQ